MPAVYLSKKAPNNAPDILGTPKYFTVDQSTFLATNEILNKLFNKCTMAVINKALGTSKNKNKKAESNVPSPNPE